MFSKFRSAPKENPVTQVSIISTGTTIIGNLESDGDIRIDGIVRGNIYCKSKVIIGAEGVVEGDIRGQQAEILGKVSGSININDLLNLRAKAFVDGDIHAGRLQVEMTVAFNGKCHTGANVVEFNPEFAKAVNE
jgi:cytoskeletal protein CcmA (bactofilin family)